MRSKWHEQRHAHLLVSLVASPRRRSVRPGSQKAQVSAFEVALGLADSLEAPVKAEDLRSDLERPSETHHRAVEVALGLFTPTCTCTLQPRALK